MVIGAYITKVWVPNPCDINGDSRSLEDLGQGKEARKKLEDDEKKAKRLADQARGANAAYLGS